MHSIAPNKAARIASYPAFKADERMCVMLDDAASVMGP